MISSTSIISLSLLNFDSSENPTTKPVIFRGPNGMITRIPSCNISQYLSGTISSNVWLIELAGTSTMTFAIFTVNHPFAHKSGLESSSQYHVYLVKDIQYV